MQTPRRIAEPQRLRALERANQVRLARAGLKRRIARGEVSAAEVILDCPAEASRWSVGELLMSQRRWGTTRCRKFLFRNQIAEKKEIGTLTERQRRLLAAALDTRVSRDDSPLTREIRVAQEIPVATEMPIVREMALASA
jgi:hypothetical protein